MQREIGGKLGKSVPPGKCWLRLCWENAHANEAPEGGGTGEALQRRRFGGGDPRCSMDGETPIQ